MGSSGLSGAFPPGVHCNDKRSIGTSFERLVTSVTSIILNISKVLEGVVVCMTRGPLDLSYT